MSGIQLSSAMWFSSQLQDLFANLPSLISSITLRVTRDNKGCSRLGGRWATWKCAMRTWWIFVFDLKIPAGKEGPVPEALWCFGWELHDNFQGFCWNKSAFSSQCNLPFIQFSYCLPPLPWLLRLWLLLLIFTETASNNFLILSFFLPHKRFATH